MNRAKGNMSRRQSAPSRRRTTCKSASEDHDPARQESSGEHRGNTSARKPCDQGGKCARGGIRTRRPPLQTKGSSASPRMYGLVGRNPGQFHRLSVDTVNNDFQATSPSVFCPAPQHCRLSGSPHTPDHRLIGVPLPERILGDQQIAHYKSHRQPRDAPRKVSKYPACPAEWPRGQQPSQA